MGALLDSCGVDKGRKRGESVSSLERRPFVKGDEAMGRNGRRPCGERMMRWGPTFSKRVPSSRMSEATTCMATSVWGSGICGEAGRQVVVRV